MVRFTADRGFVKLIILMTLLFASRLVYWHQTAHPTSHVLEAAVQPGHGQINPMSNKSSPLQTTTAHSVVSEDESESAQLNSYLIEHPNLLKAAVCFLVQVRRLDVLKKSLKMLQENFNHRFNYPILLLHEPDFMPLRDQLRRSQPGPLFFQMVKFKLPEFYEKRFGPPGIAKFCPWNPHLGYTHMCHFYSKSIFEQPSLSTLEYYWRLDDDSFIESAFNVDPFKVLRDTGAEYGYRQTALDDPLCTYNLWNVTRKFIAEHKISPTFFNRIPEELMFYNNFEVIRLRFWRTPEFRSFISVIESHAGSFRYRWGDAPIRTLALSLFIKPEKIVKFINFKYGHHGPTYPVSLPFLEQINISVKTNG